MWSPEKDIDVKITMGGAAGRATGSGRGGEGGISVFKMTLKQNTEYTIKLGVNSFQGGGVLLSWGIKRYRWSMIGCWSWAWRVCCRLGLWMGSQRLWIDSQG